MSELYKTIEDLCKSSGISIAEMCRRSNVRPTNISDLKNGRQSGLSAKNLDKIAAYFGVSVSYLLGTETKKAPSEADRVEFDDFTYAAHNYSGRLTDADKDVIKKMMATLAAANQEEAGHEQTGGNLSGIDG